MGERGKRQKKEVCTHELCPHRKNYERAQGARKGLEEEPGGEEVKEGEQEEKIRMKTNLKDSKINAGTLNNTNYPCGPMTIRAASNKLLLDSSIFRLCYLLSHTLAFAPVLHLLPTEPLAIKHPRNCPGCKSKAHPQAKKGKSLGEGETDSSSAGEHM